MKYLALSAAAAVLATLGVQAQAQDAPSPSTPPEASSPAATAPGATAPDDAAPASTAAASATQAATPVSDAEVDSFAQATVKVQKINSDATLDQTAKQQQMVAAVQASGLQPARFNEISQAIAADSALRTKVQTAMAKYAGPPQG